MSKEKIVMSEDDNKEPVKEVETKKFDKPKFRYFCDACTNVAFYASEIEEGKSGFCQSCGKPYVARKENYIKL